jgi:predicted transcriptional regulator
MVNVKRQVQEILKHLPEDCSVEDVQYHLYVIEKIRRRLESAARGEVVPQSEAEKRLEKWLIK